MRFILILLVAVSLYGQKSLEFVVDGMHCPLCTTAVKRAIRSVDGVVEVKATLNTKKVVVACEDSVTVESILAAIKTTGYEGVLTK